MVTSATSNWNPAEVSIPKKPLVTNNWFLNNYCFLVQVTEKAFSVWKRRRGFCTGLNVECEVRFGFSHLRQTCDIHIGLLERKHRQKVSQRKGIKAWESHVQNTQTTDLIFFLGIFSGVRGLLLTLVKCIWFQLRLHSTCCLVLDSHTLKKYPLESNYCICWDQYVCPWIIIQ